MSRSAPFVYFDFAPTYGVVNGAVQVEVVARIIHPGEDGQTRIEFVPTGHLRCSPAAAGDLINALTKALDMLKAASQPSGEARNLN